MLERPFTAYGDNDKIIKKGLARFEEGESEEDTEINFLDAIAFIVGEDVVADKVTRITS